MYLYNIFFFFRCTHLLLLPITSFIVVLLPHLDTVSSFSLGITQDVPRVLLPFFRPFATFSHLRSHSLEILTVFNPFAQSNSCSSQPRMPKPLGYAGWPGHWYNKNRDIPCVAKGCDKVFHTVDEFGKRRFHWSSSSPLSPSYHDHHILLAMNSQSRCVWCNYHSVSLKTLLAHEKKEHKTSNMSSIEGYLSLMRSGFTYDDANACKDQAFERMVINIGNLQNYHDALCVSLLSLFLLLIPLAGSSNHCWDSWPSKDVFDIKTNRSNEQC